MVKIFSEGEWKRKKHQPEYLRRWRKLHIGDEQIDSVYTDGAYDTKKCRQVISDRQAYADIR